jgi:hypothetical protein
VNICGSGGKPSESGGAIEIADFFAGGENGAVDGPTDEGHVLGASRGSVVSRVTVPIVSLSV